MAKVAPGRSPLAMREDRRIDEQTDKGVAPGSRGT